MSDKETKTEHPSFGLLYFSRTTSSEGRNVFGSSIKHRQTMRLELRRAELHRHLSYDSYFPTEVLFEVEMSPTQFADLVTSANTGPGIPATILWTKEDKRVPDCPAETKRQQFEQEFEDTVKQATDGLLKLLRRTKELCAQPNLKKADREEIIGLAEKMAQNIRENLPFILSQWNEQMDKTVSEAKGEAEAYFSNIVASVGLAHLEDEIRKRLPSITDKL